MSSKGVLYMPARVPLKGCPFCGFEPYTSKPDDFGFTLITCNNRNCQATVGAADKDPATAAAIWNTRRERENF